MHDLNYNKRQEMIHEMCSNPEREHRDKMIAFGVFFIILILAL
jgi:hypothetical protein